MKRFSSRDVILYLMLILLMVFAVTTLQRMDQSRDPTYGQVRTLFEQERVQSFSLEGNNLTLEVSSTMTCTSSLTSSGPAASCWTATTSRALSPPGGSACCPI